jgi:hypothetical protein
MNRTAYLLLIFNEKTLVVEGVNIFSEETPTMFGARCTAQLTTRTDRDYDGARRKAAEVYALWWPALARRFPLGPE